VEDAVAAGEAAVRLARDAGIGNVTAVRTSAVTGEGLDELRLRLGSLLDGAGRQEDAGVSWLPTDRVFAVPGFGTVVTGTLRRGALSVGDEVELMPGGRKARVRSLQIHGRPVDTATPGRRVAVNLRGVEQSDVPRGASLASPGLLTGSRWLDAGLTLLASAPEEIRGGAVVRLLTGTVETSARLRLLDRDRIEPGTHAMVQLFAEVAVAVPAGEPFIIRTLSPPATIGGGRILDPVSRRHRRHDEGVLAELRVLAGAVPAEILADRLRAAGTRGCAMAELTRLLAVSPDRMRGYLEDAAAILLPDGTVLDRTAGRELECEVLALVEKHHRDHPTDPGLPRDRLGRNAGAMAAALIARGELSNEQGRLRHRDFDPAVLLPEHDRRLIAAVEREFLTGGLMPPDASAVVGNDRERFQAIRYLTRTGVLVRAADRVQKREILFHRDALAKAQRIMTIHLADRSGGFLVADLGRLLGISRKYSIPLLEHLDAIRFTRRLEDRRVISETIGKTPGT
jgi:selenocysteine-specific elongation factor